MEFPHFIDLGNAPFATATGSPGSPTERQRPRRASTTGMQDSLVVFDAPLGGNEAQAGGQGYGRRWEGHGSILVSCCCGDALGIRHLTRQSPGQPASLVEHPRLSGPPARLTSHFPGPDQRKPAIPSPSAGGLPPAASVLSETARGNAGATIKERQ